MSDAPKWLAADWGTTQLRLWAISESGSVSAPRQSADGMGKLSPSEFEPALLALAQDWLPGGKGRVVICGMAGAKTGWAEAPYAAVPCPPVGTVPKRAPTLAPGLEVYILPGLSQANPADVMRGEETQIAGYIAQNPKWDGVICLPGSHSKWAEISAGEVVSFRSFMTGELYAALSQHTVLRHSMPTGAPPMTEHFDQAVETGLARPEALAARLFSLRAEGLLNDLPNEVAAERLSGLLIGAELAAAKPYWLGREVVLIGAPALATRYKQALHALSVPARLADVESTTLAGLTAGFALLEPQT
ncbi:MAG: 2-dehydro-3-deoxygalactonokinase [Rhodobacteraceae bacterium]|nr:2-dehydro-3-deoxygalactonokinase [Paracoccaceae bacterium]